MNLQQARQLPEIRAMLGKKEVCVNLDQNVLVQKHFGSVAPVLLASTSHLWAMLHHRPYTARVTWFLVKTNIVYLHTFKIDILDEPWLLKV